MRIAFAGTPTAAIPTLKALLDSKHEVVVVITQPPATRGRSKEPLPSEVAVFAAENNLPIFDPISINTADSIDYLESLNIDIAVVVAYGQLLKQPTLNALPKGWINAHFSLLPSWRGAAPVQAAIIHGDEITGVSTFQLVAGMDTGPVFGQVTTQIQEHETAGELLERLANLGAELVLQTINAIESSDAKAHEQSELDVSYAPKILPADGEINWQNPALAISRHIRAFTPNPGAWTTLDGMRIEISTVEMTESSDLAVGALRIEKSAVFVGTGSSEIKLREVKPSGKGWMDASAWARGLRNHSGKFSND